MRRFGIGWSTSSSWYEPNIYLGKCYLWVSAWARGVKRPTYVFFDKEAVDNGLYHDFEHSYSFFGVVLKRKGCKKN